MNRSLRIWIPSLLLAALVASGCFLISGQWIVTYSFADHGLDPLTITGPTTLVGVPVDLNTVSDYSDHKKELKDVADLAFVGKITNTAASSTDIELYIVPTPTTVYTTDATVRANGVRLWGPVTLAAGASRQVGWNDSAKLFVGRQTLINEIKGDGRFDLYAVATGGYNFNLSKGALIAVVSAGK